jgi:recombinational DNA repair protein RecR
MNHLPQRKHRAIKNLEKFCQNTIHDCQILWNYPTTQKLAFNVLLEVTSIQEQLLQLIQKHHQIKKQAHSCPNCLNHPNRKTTPYCRSRWNLSNPSHAEEYATVLKEEAESWGIQESVKV